MDRRDFLKAIGSLVGLCLLTDAESKEEKRTKERNKQPPTTNITGANKREFYLKGLIDYGKRTFDGERVLAYRHDDGSESWGVFPDYLVKDGMLKVEIAGEDFARGLVYLVLPQQFENNSNMLCVKKERIYVA